MDLGLRLKLFRIAADLRQRQVAASLGVTVNFVSMLERGKREPTLKYLRAFAKLVRVPVSILLWEPETAKNKPPKRDDVQTRIAALIAQYAESLGVMRS